MNCVELLVEPIRLIDLIVEVGFEVHSLILQKLRQLELIWSLVQLPHNGVVESTSLKLLIDVGGLVKISRVEARQVLVHLEGLVAARTLLRVQLPQCAYRCLKRLRT